MFVWKRLIINEKEARWPIYKKEYCKDREMFFLKKWAIPSFFFFNFVFSIHSWQKTINFCRWLDSNCRPLVSEGTALPTEPQPVPLPKIERCYQKLFCCIRKIPPTFLARTFCCTKCQTPSFILSLFIFPPLFHVLCSVTRLGTLLHFGQLFKACSNNYFTQIAHILRQIL